MRIIQIEDFFHPEAGYQINIISKYLARFGHEVIIFTSEMDKIPARKKIFFGTDDVAGQDKLYCNRYGVEVRREPILCHVSGRSIFNNDILAAINAAGSDVVFVHNCDSYIGIKILREYEKGRCAYGLVMDSHMLRMASKNRLSKVFHLWYRKRIAPIIVKNGIAVIRTQDDDFVEKELGVPLSQAPWISFGSDRSLFHPDGDVKKRFKKERLGNDDAFVIVYAGKIDESKGGLFLAESIRKKFDSDKEVVFVIVGNPVGDYGERVEVLLKESENRVFRYPTQKYEGLAYFFQAADLVIFPRQCSLSFYDAQACATPVLSEDNNINVDRCSHGNGENFRSGDIEDFRRKIEKFANMPDDEYEAFSENAYQFVLKNYDYEMKSREYEKMIIDAANGKRRKETKAWSM